MIAPPYFRKKFASQALPGETVDLIFELELSENAPANATNITFSDDLDAALTGLVATGLPQNNICGSGSQLSGTGVISFTGGTLAPQQQCVFTVTLQVPADAALGSYTNTTGNISATVGSLTTTGPTAQADLIIGGLTLSKSFKNDPAPPGGSVILEFNIVNSTTITATALSFSDNLADVLSGLASTSGTLTNVCGAGSQLSGTSFLNFTGSSLGRVNPAPFRFRSACHPTPPKGHTPTSAAN